MSQSPERNMAEGGGRQPIRNIAPGGGGVPDLAQQALLREIQRMIRGELESVNERFDQVELGYQRERTPQGPQRGRDQLEINQDDLYDPNEAESDQGSNISEG